MKMATLNIWIFACLFFIQACKKEDLTFEQGDLKIEIKTGDHWLHDFPLFLGLTKENPPQFAIWIEDTSGNYLSTIFATYKIATEGWINNNGNRRKEALPYWCHKRGVVYEDGLMLPTKEQPLIDGITGATPKEDISMKVTPKNLVKPFVIIVELNHSVDFNSFYPKNALEGDDNYSGGEEGSGQPAVIYAATIYSDTKYAVFELIGHSSPDGSTGELDPNLEKLTTAKSIVKSINLTIK